MSFILGKMLLEFSRPYFLALMLVGMALWFLKRTKVNAARRSLYGILILLIPTSLPIVTKALALPLESAYPPRAIEDYPNADAIVVLGGSVARTTLPRIFPQELYGSRLLAAARLFKAGKAPHLLVSGGVPYVGFNKLNRTESLDMKEILIAMGIPAAQIIEESRSRTTHENSDYTKEVLAPLQAKKILLVTSAFHLRRAVMWFTHAGFEVIPVSSEQRFSLEDINLLDFIPNTQSLFEFSFISKEYGGMLAARIYALATF